MQRFVRQPLTLTLPADVARFIAACAASSIVSTSVATAILHASGFVANGALVFTWGTWWIGDLAGLLIAAPIALTLIGRPASEWAPRRVPVGLTLALVTAFLGLGIVQVGRWSGERVRASFDHDASNASLILMTQLQEPLRALEALRGVFSVTRQLSRVEMRAATENWLRGGAVRAMGWSERVRREDVPAFEARARAEGSLGYRVFDRPAGTAGAGATAVDPLVAEPKAEAGDGAQRDHAGGDIDHGGIVEIQSGRGPVGGRIFRLFLDRDRPPGRDRGLSPDPAGRGRSADGHRRVSGDLRRRGGDAVRAPGRSSWRRLRLAGDGRATGQPGRQGACVPQPLRRRCRPDEAGRAPSGS